MRWLFVGEALVLRKEQRILAFLVLNLPDIAHASQRRGQSVSDGVSRASLRVFAVKPRWQGRGGAADWLQDTDHEKHALRVHECLQYNCSSFYLYVARVF